MTELDMLANVPAKMMPPLHTQTPAATPPPKRPEEDTAAGPAATAPQLLFMRDPKEEDEGEVQWIRAV